MKFEEVLSLMREGKKAYNPYYGDKGEYWMAGYQESKILDIPMIMTIFRMNEKNELILTKESLSIPLYLLLDENWEIKEDE